MAPYELYERWFGTAVVGTAAVVTAERSPQPTRMYARARKRCGSFRNQFRILSLRQVNGFARPASAPSGPNGPNVFAACAHPCMCMRAINYIVRSTIIRSMRICIIGGGVAGLQVSDILTAGGHDCYIFEREASVGGVWRENYVGYALQVPMELYEFPGMPSLGKEGTFPDGKAVMDYILKYVEQRDLVNRCKIHCSEPVLKLARNGSDWSVLTDVHSYTFDFCVVCTGMYNVPNVPIANDKTIHSSAFTDASIVADKHVVVLGAGKSAIDCAVAASKQQAASVTLMARTMHWPVPRYIAGVVPFQWGTYSRLGHFLLPPHWDLSPIETRSCTARVVG